MKQCSRCQRKRKLKFFRKDKRYRQGRSCWCNFCFADYNRTPERKKAQAKRWKGYISNPDNKEYERNRGRKKYHRNPGKAKDRILQRLYGISLRKFRRTKRCLLCKRDVQRLVADHNHKTNKFRGVLCVTCNLMIAWIERIPSALRKIQQYIKRGR